MPSRYEIKIGEPDEYTPSHQPGDYASRDLSGLVYGVPGWLDCQCGPGDHPNRPPRTAVGPAVGRGRLHPALCRPHAHCGHPGGSLRAQAPFPTFVSQNKKGSYMIALSNTVHFYARPDAKEPLLAFFTEVLGLQVHEATR